MGPTSDPNQSSNPNMTMIQIELPKKFLPPMISNFQALHLEVVLGSPQLILWVGNQLLMANWSLGSLPPPSPRHRAHHISLFTWSPLSYAIPTSTSILTPTDYSQYSNQGDPVKTLSQVMLHICPTPLMISHYLEKAQTLPRSARSWKIQISLTWFPNTSLSYSILNAQVCLPAIPQISLFLPSYYPHGLLFPHSF